MSNSPHYDYVRRKTQELAKLRLFARDEADAMAERLAKHMAQDADRAWLALRAELEAIRFDVYSRSLCYDPHGGYNGHVDARIAELRHAREALTRALTQLGIDADDFGAEAAAKEQAEHDERQRTSRVIASPGHLYSDTTSVT